MTVGTVFRALRKVEELVLAWGIILMAALTVLNVFSRSLFGNSLAFAEELSQFLIILVTFVGLSFGASRGRHIRMTAIYDQLSDRWRKGLMVLIATTTSLLMFALAVYAVDYVLTVQELGTVSPALQVPLYLIYMAAPLGFVLSVALDESQAEALRKSTGYLGAVGTSGTEAGDVEAIDNSPDGQNTVVLTPRDTTQIAEQRYVIRDAEFERLDPEGTWYRARLELLPAEVATTGTAGTGKLGEFKAGET